MRAEAIYSALLRCYPLAFRDEYGDEMRLMFAEQLVDARRDGGRLKELALWAGAAARRSLRRAQGALSRDSSGSSIRGPDNDGAARLHCRRDHLPRSRHRRQHGHLQPVARGPAGSSPGRAKARRAPDADRPGRSRDVDRPLGESNRWPACLGVVRRVRAVARQRQPDSHRSWRRRAACPRCRRGLAVAPRNRYARAWYPGPSSRCWAAGPHLAGSLPAMSIAPIPAKW